jgi:hypothetical protein
MDEASHTLPFLCRVIEDGHGGSCGFSSLIGPILSKLELELSMCESSPRNANFADASAGGSATEALGRSIESFKRGVAVGDDGSDVEALSRFKVSGKGAECSAMSDGGGGG